MFLLGLSSELVRFCDLVYDSHFLHAHDIIHHSIEAHPRMPFYAIINPDSGPGGANTQPGAEYQQCIPILQAASDNVVVLGYVASRDADPSKASGVTQDVNTYAGWNEAYRVDGIFFDQVSGTSADFSTYQDFVSHAQQTFNFVCALFGVTDPR